VLGEFTIAYNLGYNNFQVDLFAISRNAVNPGVLFAASLGGLVFAFVLLLVMSYVGRRLRRGRA
jgi:putative spermidine/putrescine transport system permease protein